MLNDADIDLLCQQLRLQGYAVCEQFLPLETIADLRQQALQLQKNNHLRLAKTGLESSNDKGSGDADLHEKMPKIRGDSIVWLEEDDPAACVQTYLQAMQQLRTTFNQQLLLNLHQLEAHFAIYPPGAGYAKHLDQFGAGSHQVRQVSSVLYLNHDWQKQDGGQLRLYLADDKILEISPTGGKLVLFLSGEFWHEVLPAQRERISLTGWFRRRDNRI